MENLNEALGLLVVGMITVFVILGLVVFIGNMVIRLTNRFIPYAQVRAVAEKASGKNANPQKLAAIVATVDIITEGRGKIENIEKK